jgi:hypothetical protein
MRPRSTIQRIATRVIMTHGRSAIISEHGCPHLLCYVLYNRIFDSSALAVGQYRVTGFLRRVPGEELPETCASIWRTASAAAAVRVSSLRDASLSSALCFLRSGPRSPTAEPDDSTAGSWGLEWRLASVMECIRVHAPRVKATSDSEGVFSSVHPAVPFCAGSCAVRVRTETRYERGKRFISFSEGVSSLVRRRKARKRGRVGGPHRAGSCLLGSLTGCM